MDETILNCVLLKKILAMDCLGGSALSWIAWGESALSWRDRLIVGCRGGNQNLEGDALT